MPKISDLDLQHVLEGVGEKAWDTLLKKRIFVTGGTGFIGCWLLESLLYASDTLSLGVEVTVLTRNPARFMDKVPHIANRPEIELLHDNIREFRFPKREHQIIIHAAAEAETRLNKGVARRIFDTIVHGTQRIVSFAEVCDCENLLFLSSGAVYGKQPFDLGHVKEDYNGTPGDLEPESGYGIAKRSGEWIVAEWAKRTGKQAKIARPFCFIGPYVPLSSHYTIGSFIGNAICGFPITIHGSGATTRSYLYASDMAIWLWSILLRGENCRPYNVGSSFALTLREIAEIVTQKSPGRVIIENNGTRETRYVPCTERIRTELGVNESYTFTDCVRMTAEWFGVNDYE